MKSFTTLQVAAAGILSMATLATAQSACAVECFTQVITDHPPLDCKEANMYLCFCKMPSLQNYFIDCARSDCPDAAEEAISFGTNLCADMGVPIDPPTEEEPTDEETVPEPTTPAPEPEETQPEEEEEEEPTDEETAPEPTSAAPEPEETEAAEEEEETSAPVAKPTKTYGHAAPSGEVPTGATPTPTDIVANAGSAVSVSGFVALAGAALAVCQLL